MKKLLLGLGAVAAVAAPVAAVVACDAGTFDGGNLALTRVTDSTLTEAAFKPLVKVPTDKTTATLATTLGFDESAVFGTNDASVVETVTSVKYDEAKKLLVIKTHFVNGELKMDNEYDVTITFA